MPFDPSLHDIKLSVNVIVEGVTMTYSIDHQTWPTAHVHNGQKHVFDETSPIRLHSMNDSEDAVDTLELNKLSEPETEVWKAKHLIGKEWEEDAEDGKAKHPAVKVGPRDARFRSIRSRTPNLAGSSKRTSNTPAKKRKADSFFGTSDDEFGSEDVTTCEYDSPDDIPLPPRVSSTVTRVRESATRVPVSLSIPVPPQTSAQLLPLAQNHGRIIRVVSSDGQEIYMNVNPRVTGAKFVRAVIDRMGRGDEDNESTVQVLIDGLTWRRDESVTDIGLWDDLIPVGSDAPHKRYIEVHFRQCGGKPVIYLYPPQSMSVDVTLSLCPECKSIVSIRYD
jgi:hypothetical protein